jgi:hypothetical protein
LRPRQLLASRVLEARQPVVDPALAAFAEPCVCTAELQWLLLDHTGFDRDERQQTAADQHRESVRRPPERERHSDWSVHEVGGLARKLRPVSYRICAKACVRESWRLKSRRLKPTTPQPVRAHPRDRC